jgi:hypothetical protein
MNPQPSLDSPRVFAAADALLDAVRSPAGKHAVIEVLFPRNPERTEAPPASGFTHDEFLLAMDFLVRAGFLDDEA